MQKDESQYTFLLTRNNRSGIYIRRIEVSKKRLHSSFSAFLFLSLVSLGVFGMTKFSFTDFNKVYAQNQTSEASQQFQAIPKSQNLQVKTYDYSRPNSDIEKIGGPDDDSFQLTNESETEETQMEAQLRVIENGDQQFIPSMWSHLGKINNEFGYRRNPFGGRSYEFHPGLDIDGERGDSIIAPARGTVVKAGWQGGYGNLIEVNHGNGLITRYGHLSKIGVQVGDQIERGQIIGLVGSTGRSTGPHLHFEIRLGDKAINPRRFLPPEITK